MKVVFVSNCPLPYHTPILNELAQLVDLHVIYMSRNHPLTRPGALWSDFQDEWGEEPRFDHSFFWSRTLGSARVDFRAQLSLGVSRRLSKLAPDVVFFSSWGPLMVEPLLWKRARARRAVMWAESTSFSGLMRGYVSDGARRRLLSQVDAFVSNGTKATEYLTALGVDERSIVTSRLPSRSTDPQEIQSPTGDVPRGGPRYLFVGRLIDRKRPSLTVDAFETVRSRIPGASLTIVGDGPLMPEMTRRAQLPGASLDVVGRVEGVALDAIYDGHDVLVMPAVREVWGLVVNEAMSRGLFIVATEQVGSAWDLVDDHTGLIVPADDPAALANAMERAARAPQDADARRARAERVAACTPAAFARDVKRAAEIALGESTAVVPGWTGDGRERVLEEARAWDGAVQEVLGDEAALVAVSRWTPDARVYRSDREAAKIRFRRGDRPKGVRDLREESVIVRELRSGVRTGGGPDWEFLATPWIPGVSADRLLAEWSLRMRLVMLARVARSLPQLHRKGIAHTDLRPDNVLITGDSVQLVDFDRAFRSSRLMAAFADWVGVTPRGFSWYPFWKLALIALAPRIQSLGRRVRTLVAPGRLPAGIADQPAEIQLLATAWDIAARSDANAPGQGIAYYAFTYAGVHFPGERPWYLRWEMIRRNVDLTDRRFVELGCNMGLLSTFALIYGAREAVGADTDEGILASAGAVARALGVSPRFVRADLGQDPDWEDELGVHDIVVAMSLLEWVPDKARVLRYIGRFPEVLYEGHEATETEIERLRLAGFTDVRVIGETERGRAVLYGKKPDPA